MNAFAQRKVWIFGSLGALGCLIGWAAGEGLLAATQPANTGEASRSPSLASRAEVNLPPPIVPTTSNVPPVPTIPKREEAATSVVPPNPVVPAAPKREPPPPLPPDAQKRLDLAGGKSGQLQITLIWNNRNDLDLHCIDPYAEEIYFQHKQAKKSKGTLDVDRNAGTDLTSTPVENIYFPTGAPLGRYRVYLNHYANRGDPDPTDYSINILIEDRRLSFEGKITHGDDKRLIHEFELSGLRMVAPKEVVVFPGTQNKFSVRLERDPQNTKPVRLTFKGETSGLALPDEVTIPGDRDSIDIEVAAKADATIDTRTITVVASGAYGKADTKMQVSVKPLPAALQIAAPSEVVLFPGGKNRFQVRLHRYHNDQPIQLSFTGDAPGLKLPAKVTVPGDKHDAEFEVEAIRKTADGMRKVSIVADGAHGRVEQPFQILVQTPPARLHFVAPKAVPIRAGETNRIPIRIAREWFEEPVQIRLASPVEGLSLDEATIPPDREDVELILTADKTAKEGTVPLTLSAKGGKAASETKCSVEISPALPPATPPWSWRLVAVIGLWTALLAIGLSLALVIGQNRYLSRPWLSGRQAGIILFGGGLAGLVAGGIGQSLFALLVRSGVPQVGFLAGWLLLGGLVGRGIGFFIPNLHAWRSCIAGIVGGLLGAIAFILVSKLGDISGRLTGAMILGCCIGLMVAIVEVAFRKAWLEVRYSPREVIAVNLGPEPIKIGGDNKLCTIWARGAAPIALRFWIREGKVVCEDVTTRRTEELAAGSRRQAGSVEVTVRTGSSSAGDSVPPRPTPPPPPRRSEPLDDDPFPLPLPMDKPASPASSGTQPAAKPKPATTSGTQPAVKPSGSSVRPAPPVPKPSGSTTVPPPRPPQQASSAPVCPHCRSKIAPGSRVCGICGEDL